jgi:hypothetical protein
MLFISNIFYDYIDRRVVQNSEQEVSQLHQIGIIDKPSTKAYFAPKPRTKYLSVIG